jgi:hypothetical protein
LNSFEGLSQDQCESGTKNIEAKLEMLMAINNHTWLFLTKEGLTLPLTHNDQALKGFLRVTVS